MLHYSHRRWGPGIRSFGYSNRFRPSIRNSRRHPSRTGGIVVCIAVIVAGPFWDTIRIVRITELGVLLTVVNVVAELRIPLAVLLVGDATELWIVSAPGLVGIVA